MKQSSTFCNRTTLPVQNQPWILNRLLNDLQNSENYNKSCRVYIFLYLFLLFYISLLKNSSGDVMCNFEVNILNKMSYSL